MGRSLLLTKLGGNFFRKGLHCLGAKVYAVPSAAQAVVRGLKNKKEKKKKELKISKIFAMK